MDIRLNKTQTNIAKEARRFLKKECPVEYVDEMCENERGFTDDMWSKMAAMDWMAMRIPEAYGGVGMDQVDLNLVLEEMGRVVFPGPFFSTVVLAAEAILEAGSEEQKTQFLTDIADGNRRGTLAVHEADGGADPSYIRMEARQNNGDFVLNGSKISVSDAQAGDFMVCAARTRASDDPTQGITLFLVEPGSTGVSITSLPTMDQTRKLSAVEFKDVRLNVASVLGEVHNGWKPLQRVLQRAQVGLSAECVGGAQRAMEIGTDYAKVRIQYEQPIGAFQAIKHRCAQMYLEVESARSLLYWAAWAQDHGQESEATVSASAVKSYASEAFTHNADSAIQVLGGTGFTLESEVHLYLKRAKANEMAFGDPVYHRERVVQLLTA